MTFELRPLALLSPCGTFRYRLDRYLDDVPEGVTIAYFGVNPSTADHKVDDLTVKKWRQFTRLHGGNHFIAGNVFSFRATDVRNLRGKADLFGEGHWEALADIIREADILVPCWGKETKVPPELRHHFAKMRRLLVASGKPIKSFGQAVCGSPLHPLMLPYTVTLSDWSPL